MALFVAVVNNGSFSAAADRLGLSRAQVSKAVAQLEQHLGSRLLNRTTRRTSLTDIGRIYYERCSAILQDIDELEDMTGDQVGRLQGRLSLSAPTSFGIAHLNPLISGFLQLNPEVQISLSLTDRMINVVEEGFDLVIRIAELDDSSLIARKLAPCKRVFCAAPAYIEQHGSPKVPQDLAIHHCLIYSNELRPDTWILHGPGGTESVRVNGPVCADNGDILKSAAIAGLGVTLLPTFIVGDALKTGQLKPVLTDYCPPEIAIYAVFPSRRYLSAKVRAFVDFLAKAFGDSPAWDDF